MSRPLPAGPNSGPDPSPRDGSLKAPLEALPEGPVESAIEGANEAPKQTHSAVAKTDQGLDRAPADADSTDAGVAGDRGEPTWPQPQPYTANLLKRLARGLHSWFGLLNEWDFRIGSGSTSCFGLELVLVNEPALVRQVLVEGAEAFPKHPYTQWILEPLIGRGLFAVNGAEWQQQRRLVDQALQTTQLRRAFPLMQGAVEAMLERLEAESAAQPGETTVTVQQPAAQAPGSQPSGGNAADLLPFDAQEAMTLVTADVIVRTMLSRPLPAAEAREIFAAFARYQRRAGLVMVLRLLRLPKTWLQPLLRADAGRIRAWLRAAIAERQRSRSDPAGGAAAGSGPQDLLTALEQAEDRPADPTAPEPEQVPGRATPSWEDPSAATVESGPSTGRNGRRFSQEQLVDQVCVLFLAGHETSAGALAMACYLLARYPEAQARFVAEIQAVQRGGSPRAAEGGPRRPLGYDDLRRLPYGTALLQETLRLYPPLSFFIRESQAPSQLGESRCPMGALLAISPWVIQRHEQHWPEPNHFRPERFLADQASEADRRMARDAYLPFGLGPRKCPGAAFAMQEALLVLAELVSRYELLPDPSQEPDLVGRLTLRSRNGIRLSLRRRQNPGQIQRSESFSRK